MELKNQRIEVNGLREEEELYVLRATELPKSPTTESCRRAQSLVGERDFKLSELEKGALGSSSPRSIITSFWQKRKAYPLQKYILIICCSLEAAIQWWDETAVNGAQVFYAHAFGIASEQDSDRWTLEFLNAAPYIMSFTACLCIIRFRQVASA
ncbi:hypothetical protein F4782DRAFT_532106 [Xylaria castorea]|nr:hypothetical protein F4782DRAFT_532106 [Xylaria castorea]